MTLADLKMRLYTALPVAAQEQALAWYARRLDRLYFGPVYERVLSEIRTRETWTGTDWLAWQEMRLADIVAHARARVPYYRQAFAGLPAIRSAGDLRLAPRLDKQRMRQREREFLDETLDPRSLVTEKTSGSTGTSLTVHWDRSSLQAFHAAYEARVREAVGVTRFTPRAMLGGRPIVDGRADRPPFWRYNRHWRQFYLSSYHLAPRWTAGYVDALRRSGSEWLTGYGSAIAALAEQALEQGLPPLPLRAVVVSGDTFLPGMRRSVERFFPSTVRDQYGQAEGVCWIMECAHGRLHVCPDFGILEILDEQGAPCPPGVTGELVATGLLNRAMPLIRYRMGDEAAWSLERDCPCGQPFPMIENLCGRLDDYLLLPDGRRIGRLSTAAKAAPAIHSMQIVQDRPDHAFLFIRPGPGYVPADAGRVLRDIQSRIGPFPIDQVDVPEIPKSPAGKTRLVVRLAERPEWRAAYSPWLNEERKGLRS